MSAVRRSKVGRVSPAPVLTEAQRQKSLRKAHGLSITQLSEATGIGESSLRNFESRGVPLKDDVRVKLAAAFGLTRDQYARYLDGAMTVEEATAAAPKRPSLPPKSKDRVPLGPVLRSHPEWADLCVRAVVEARKMDPPLEIAPETLKQVGFAPWLFGPLEDVEVEDVIDLCRVVQRRQRT